MNFWKWEVHFHHRMAQTSIPCHGESTWLSCDHTFKSVRNIGIVRQADDNWIKQYKGLFCVLNAAGQVVTWKMTKGLAIDDVKDIMQALHTRFQLQGVTLQEFFVDNCCALRQKLQAIFGQHLKVYLDVFHAVQRITRKIPKRHPYHAECMRALRLVFRQPSDQGNHRTMTTPPIDQLKQQLLNFKSTWEHVSCNGKRILPPAAIIEIRSLLIHVQKGCLSGIHPGRGTTKNERLHRNLNSLMANSKYGVEFSYAMLTSAFFRHNEMIAANAEKRQTKTITEYSQGDLSFDGQEAFGLTVNRDKSKVRQPDNIALDLPPVQSQKVSMKLLLYQRVQECVSKLSIDEVTADSEDTETDLPELTAEDTIHLFMQGVSSFYVSNSLEKMSQTADLKTRDTSFLALVRGLSKKHGQESNLDKLLTSWNFKKVAVSGDGSCLFTSVANSLLLRIQSGDEEIIKHYCEFCVIMRIRDRK